MLGIDVEAGAAMVPPGDDRAARPIREDRGVDLGSSGTANRDPARSPLRGSQGVHILGVDVVVRAATEITPGDDCASRAVGGDGGQLLGIGDGAYRHTVRRPQGYARGAHPPGVDI